MPPPSGTWSLVMKTLTPCASCRMWWSCYQPHLQMRKLRFKVPRLIRGDGANACLLQCTELGRACSQGSVCARRYCCCSFILFCTLWPTAQEQQILNI